MFTAQQLWQLALKTSAKQLVQTVSVKEDLSREKGVLSPNLNTIIRGNVCPLKSQILIPLQWNLWKVIFRLRIQICLHHSHYHHIFITPQMGCIKSYKKKINETFLLTSNMSKRIYCLFFFFFVFKSSKLVLVYLRQ